MFQLNTNVGAGLAASLTFIGMMRPADAAKDSSPKPYNFHNGRPKRRENYIGIDETQDFISHVYTESDSSSDENHQQHFKNMIKEIEAELLPALKHVLIQGSRLEQARQQRLEQKQKGQGGRQERKKQRRSRLRLGCNADSNCFLVEHHGYLALCKKPNNIVVGYIVRKAGKYILDYNSNSQPQPVFPDDYKTYEAEGVHIDSFITLAKDYIKCVQEEHRHNTLGGAWPYVEFSNGVKKVVEDNGGRVFYDDIGVIHGYMHALGILNDAKGQAQAKKRDFKKFSGGMTVKEFMDETDEINAEEAKHGVDATPTKPRNASKLEQVLGKEVLDHLYSNI